MNRLAPPVRSSPQLLRKTNGQILLQNTWSRDKIRRVSDPAFNAVALTLHSRSLASDSALTALLELQAIDEVGMVATPPGLNFAPNVTTLRYTDSSPEESWNTPNGGRSTRLKQFVARWPVDRQEGWAGCHSILAEEEQLRILGTTQNSPDKVTVLSDFDDIAAHMSRWRAAPQRGKNRFRLFVTSEPRLVKKRKPLELILNEKAQSSALAMTKICSPREALDFIDLAFKASGEYVYDAHWSGNKWESYYLQTRRIIPSYLRASSAVSFPFDNRIAKAQDIRDHIEAIASRMSNALACRDLIAIGHLSEDNATGHFDQVFAVGYFVPLVTGMFDSLAWISAIYCKMKLGRRQVSLRFPLDPKARKGGFHEQLEKSNKALHTFVTNDRTQALVSVFYPLRDVIQHRTYIHGTPLVKLGETFEPRIGIDLDDTSKKAVESLSKTSGEAPSEIGVESLGPRTFLYPNEFTDWAIPKLGSIINQYFSLLQLNQFLKPDEIASVDGALTAFAREYESHLRLQAFCD